MAGVLVNNPQWKFPAAEMIDNSDLADASFSYNGSRAVMVVQVDAKFMEPSLPGTILGYATRKFGGMSRKLPWQHPFFKTLWASEISSIKGLSYESTNQGVTGYYKYQITVVFSSPAWNVYPDVNGILSGGQTEDQRFVDYQSDPRVDMVALDSAAFAIADGAAGTLNGSPVLANVGIRLPKMWWNYVWVQVPQNYIMDAKGLPVNLLASMGTVNADSFRDMPAGTLLCDAVTLTPTIAPVPASFIFGENTPNGTVPRTYTVGVHIGYWNPTTASATKGWNLYPAPDRNFYNIQTQIGNNQQYTTSTFANIWLPV